MNPFVMMLIQQMMGGMGTNSFYGSPLSPYGNTYGYGGNFGGSMFGGSPFGGGSQFQNSSLGQNPQYNPFANFISYPSFDPFSFLLLSGLFGNQFGVNQFGQPQQPQQPQQQPPLPGRPIETPPPLPQLPPTPIPPGTRPVLPGRPIQTPPYQAEPNPTIFEPTLENHRTIGLPRTDRNMLLGIGRNLGRTY